MRIVDMLERIQGEFKELPGLRLTKVQARRLWALDPLICAALLDALVDVQFLTKTADGAFVKQERSAKPH